MIELRWKWGLEPAPQYGKNVSLRTKVLQWRKSINPEEIGIHPPIWDDWEDVPTEQLDGTAP